ncbi:MBOAT family protein [Massilia sp. IC2-476]|uniref:MBOAT family O-acyltransferase n=1 Tax=Massilia sp. IC2-476 TaxID=2887199 RepID=UPI001D11A602|nr:MBOAT family protein [Massilia sp. IC2-476]MCC2971553.1 MBOAT family protein [Massilia sp. IC2-476]
MLFSSIIFLFFFLPVFLSLYYLLPWKNAVLLIGSLVFYGWAEPRFLPLLLLSAALNYGVGLALASTAAHRRRARIWLTAGVSANLGLLIWFKYAGFLAEAINSALAAGLPVPHITLPLGISFFTFQGISYLVDVYRGEVAAQSSFLRFATYKALFPQLIAGPIVRYRQVADEMGKRVLSNERLLAGFQLFALGLAQKVLIANTLAFPADRLFGADHAELSALTAWLGLLCYTLQIYYDFAGYSNMAIGLGHMLGLSFPPNFDRPYSARSLTEFWQRWHISLSSWFRDYLYIPLGGNRRGPVRTWFNLGLVFLLCGLWHGAAWTFVVWGAWHGAWLIVERMGLRKLLDRLPWPLAQAWTLAVAMLGWVWFRAADMDAALSYFAALAGGSANPSGHPWQAEIASLELVALAVGLAFAVMPTGRAPVASSGTPPALMAGRWARLPLAVACVALCACSLAGGTYNPFLYYRF